MRGSQCLKLSLTCHTNFILKPHWLQVQISAGRIACGGGRDRAPQSTETRRSMHSTDKPTTSAFSLRLTLSDTLQLID